jgi:Fic family protein
MDRESKPDRAEIETDAKQRARREAANGVRQTDFVFYTIERYLEEGKQFKLRPSFLGELNRLAVDGLTSYAGVPRPHGMAITGSGHAPPPPGDVQPLIEELCDYVNDNWSRSPIHLAAYVMWRLNWIHPYDDGNGRTSRAASYVVLSLRLGVRLPGRETIVDQIVHSKGAYYRALEAADRRFADGELDVGEMEELISNLLAKQFAKLHEDANRSAKP